MTKTTFALLRIVVYAFVVMAGFTLAYLSIGPFIETAALRIGGSDDTASLSRNIVCMIIGFGLGELVKRWLLRRFADEREER